MFTYENNISLLINNLKNAKRESLEEIKTVGFQIMNDNVAVDTGELKSGNRASIKGDGVEFRNDVKHGPYVEFGTYKMAARPFMGLIADRYSGRIKVIIEKKFTNVGDF